jgi:hypothetical protein
MSEDLEGRIFRAVARAGKVWGKGISQNVVWYVVKNCCERAVIASCPLHPRATKFMPGKVANIMAIPSRNRGWSSTARIRIEFGSGPMLS